MQNGESCKGSRVRSLIIRTVYQITKKAVNGLTEQLVSFLTGLCCLFPVIYS